MSVSEELGKLEKVDIGGHKLEVLHEEGEIPYLVFVHGGPGSLWNPVEQIKDFHGEKGVISYSLSGYGDSDGRKNDSLEKHVDDLRKLIEKFNLDDDVVLHGHSYGTEIVLDYVSRYNVKGLIVSGGHAYIKPPLRNKLLIRFILASHIYKLPITENFLLRALGKRMLHPDIDEDKLEEILLTTPAPANRAAWETMPKCFWNYQPPELEEIEAPALFLQGAKDNMVKSMENVRETVERLPNAELKVFKESGHVPMIEQPEEYDRAIEEFLERIETQSS